MCYVWIKMMEFDPILSTPICPPVPPSWGHRNPQWKFHWKYELAPPFSPTHTRDEPRGQTTGEDISSTEGIFPFSLSITPNSHALVPLRAFLGSAGIKLDSLLPGPGLLGVHIFLPPTLATPLQASPLWTGPFSKMPHVIHCTSCCRPSGAKGHWEKGC